jgi:hypothetical protein
MSNPSPTVETTNPCGACGHPQAGHRTRYAAGIGDHEWLLDFDSPILSGIRDRHTTQTPATIHHPQVAHDPSRTPGGGDKLPGHNVNHTTRNH